ncbi:NADH dehydrogenase subunit E [Primorskyibacter sedentarius]|uniref:NADH dehydrogenase subunit E n=1 Tax=Primorskyibacter sedentarius TaxID=745311 RepID=A0A4R3JB96_9RHOB|nr:NADH-quinone oxidoreductase subunit E [Primorskyibacter sedentarius]TCS62356.1 NADH dehydrogenase subunit E [Primorskyibacter sedentarius]
MLRRLHHEQPESFAFTPANLAWAEAQITKYPEGRQASAVIPLLWRAQEQEGWLTRPAIEAVADMLGMAYMRVVEVASFYFMFQLQPVGTVAHIQVCGTTSCMICGAEDLIGVCRDKIAGKAHELSADGKFSWEEVECLGACANAPMAQIGKDYYEDLTAERLSEIIDELAAGKVPVPGPQNGRFASEPKSGLTSLKEYESGHTKYNASAQLATDIGDTVKRIDGTEVPLLAPWQNAEDKTAPAASTSLKEPQPAANKAVDETGIDKREAEAQAKAKPEASAKTGDAATTEAPAPSQDAPTAGTVEGVRPQALDGPRNGQADDLKQIKGVGPKLEKLCNTLGFYHFDQIAGWSDAEVAWVDENLEGFKGRVTRDEWVSQARILADGGETEFSSRVKKGGDGET